MRRYRMLILDCHGSHLTAELDRTCTENNIIPIWMPPHCSHLLQPLDVSYFPVLKRQYGQLVEQRMRLGVTAVLDRRLIHYLGALETGYGERIN